MSGRERGTGPSLDLALSPHRLGTLVELSVRPKDGTSKTGRKTDNVHYERAQFCHTPAQRRKAIPVPMTPHPRQGTRATPPSLQGPVRIEGPLCCRFFELTVQALIELEIRGPMKADNKTDYRALPGTS